MNEEFSIRFMNEGGETRTVPRQISTTLHPSNEAVETLAITFICESIPCWRGIRNGSNCTVVAHWARDPEIARLGAHNYVDEEQQGPRSKFVIAQI